MEKFDDPAFLTLLRETLAEGEMMTGEPMSRHTTFRIGGPADIFVSPSSTEELAKVLALAKEYGVPVTIIGNGSNILVRDGGIRGLVISFGKPFSKIERKDNSVFAWAGATLGAVSLFAAGQRLSGLEFAVGIPGSLGGAVFMNAGAYGGEISQVIREVLVMTKKGEVKKRGAETLSFGYRHSVFQENGEIVCGALLALKEGDESEIKERMADYTRRRMEKQPLEKPSAGSSFKRPTGNFAGTLIEKSGLKGFGVGGAQVSEKHAGFIINRGGATAADVLALMAEVRRRVEEESGVQLEPEIRIIGEDE